MGLWDRIVAALQTPRADASVMPDIPDGGQSPTVGAEPAPIVYLSRPARQRVASAGIGRRIVHAVPSLATAKGWTVRDGEGERLDVSPDDLGLRAKLRDVDALARQDGVAYLLMIVRGVQNLREPLPEGPHEVERLHVVSYEEAVPVLWETSLLSADFGLPKVYSVNLSRDAVALSVGMVHRSHLIRVGGLTIDPTQTSPPSRDGADFSAVEAYWPYLADLDLTGAAMAQTARMISIPWLQLPNAEPAMAGEKRAAAGTALARLRRAMGIFGLVPLPTGAQMGVLSPSLAGTRDLSAIQYERLSSVEGAPVEWLTGMRVGGLGADDAGKSENLRIFIGSHQDEVLGPALAQFYEVKLGTDDKRTIEFAPLDEPTEAQAAAVALTRAQAAQVRVASGITTPDEEREILSGEGPSDLRGLDAADDVAELTDEEVAAVAVEVDPRADADTYAIPDAAKGNAAKALRWREEHGDAVQGGTSTGWARARQLAAGGRVSADDVVTIAAWWARHRDNAREPDAEYADEPWRDAGYVSGLLWGGKSGDAWATEARKAIE